MTLLLYLAQITVLTAFVAFVYMLGRRRLRHWARKLLVTGMFGLLLLSTLAVFSPYEWISISDSGMGSFRSLPAIGESHNEHESSFGIAKLSLSEILLTVLFAAIAVRVVLFAVELIRLERMVRRASAISVAELTANCEPGAKFLDTINDNPIAERFHFAVSPEVSKAATFGFWKQTILFPTDWQQWSQTKLDAVVVHELEHARRFDCVLRIMTEFVTALHFYHPIVRWLANQYRLEQEFDADKAVVTTIGDSEYEALLVQESLGLENYRRLTLAPSFGICTKSILRHRLERIQERERLPDSGGLRIYSAAIAALVALVLGVSGVRVDANPNGGQASIGATVSTHSLSQDPPPADETDSTDEAKTKPDSQLAVGFSKYFTLPINTRKSKRGDFDVNRNGTTVNKTFIYEIGK